jgi:membrane protein implicated in regulation of membrane protease activity
LLTVFQVCFFVGIGLMLLSLIFGNIFEVIGIDGLDLDFDIGLSLFIPISPILLIFFITVYGGVGWLIWNAFPALGVIFIILLAFAAGIVLSTLMNLFVIRPLKKAQNTSTPDSEDLVGLRAKVTETILENGFGEISYVINGNSYTSPAKGIHGEAFKAGQEVVICWITDYIFYVSLFDI